MSKKLSFHFNRNENLTSVSCSLFNSGPFHRYWKHLCFETKCFFVGETNDIMKQFSWCQENVTRGITVAENTAKRSLYKKKTKTTIYCGSNVPKTESCLKFSPKRLIDFSKNILRTSS